MAFSQISDQKVVNDAQILYFFPKIWAWELEPA